ncbi:MAG: NFACT RNA binding domain-containing protein, partial [Polyangiaceae bacterium]
MNPSLVGGTIQRVTVGRSDAGDVATLQVRVPGSTRHLVIASSLGVGVLEAQDRTRLRGLLRGSTSPAQRHFRAKTEGARIEQLAPKFVRLSIDDRIFSIACDGATLRLADEVEQQPTGLPLLTSEALVARGAAIVDDLVRRTAGARRMSLGRAIAKAKGRIERRIDAMREDLVKMQQAGRMAERARLFVGGASFAARGAAVLEGLDWENLGEDGEPARVQMAIDPAKGAKEQIDAIFRRARRLKEGERTVRFRLEQAEAARDALAHAATRIDDPEPDLDAVEAAARTAAPRDFKGAALAAAPSARSPVRPKPTYRAFLASSGGAILVGRGAPQNDELTLHVARPHDLWLHVKSRAGAHVVVRLERNAPCAPEVLVEAAHLAAHFSDARDEGVVEVQYAPRRYVRKPRGSEPGSVVVDREKVIVLRKNEA